MPPAEACERLGLNLQEAVPAEKPYVPTMSEAALNARTKAIRCSAGDLFLVNGRPIRHVSGREGREWMEHSHNGLRFAAECFNGVQDDQTPDQCYTDAEFDAFARKCGLNLGT
jgi:hypothetical protein